MQNAVVRILRTERLYLAGIFDAKLRFRGSEAIWINGESELITQIVKILDVPIPINPPTRLYITNRWVRLLALRLAVDYMRIQREKAEKVIAFLTKKLEMNIIIEEIIDEGRFGA